MATWQQASKVFTGGTLQVKELKGRKVRTTYPIQGLLVYDPDPASKQQQTLDLRRGALGLVANPHPTRDEILIAFLNDPAKAPGSLTALRYGEFKAVSVNVPTFRLRFEVESA
jgi:hypothetical protein